MADTQIAAPDPVAGLIDIPMPREVSLWPQTWEARSTAALLLVLIAAALWRFVRYRRLNRYRREALAELSRIKGDRSETLTWLALVLRRTALYAYPRREVAHLSGAAWLTFLDRSYGGHEFSNGIGRVLANGPYQPGASNDFELEPLRSLIKRWIRGHHA